MRSFLTTLVTALIFFEALASAMPNHGVGRLHKTRKIAARKLGSKKAHCATRKQAPKSTLEAGTTTSTITTIALETSSREEPAATTTDEDTTPTTTPSVPSVSLKPITTFTTTLTTDTPTPKPTKSPAQPTPPPVEEPVEEPPTTGGLSADAVESLKWHNVVRRQHNAADLTWSDRLASAAQKWAQGCAFKHSGGSLGPFGENLAAGTSSQYSVEDAVTAWTDEVSDYNPSNPVASHYTQVVWRGTKEVGCAMVSGCRGIFGNSPARYYVCEYSPPGNVIGRFAENVQ